VYIVVLLIESIYLRVVPKIKMSGIRAVGSSLLQKDIVAQSLKHLQGSQYLASFFPALKIGHLPLTQLLSALVLQ